MIASFCKQNHANGQFKNKKIRQDNDIRLTKGHLSATVPRVMAKVPVIQLRKGHAVNYNGDICIVRESQLKTPPAWLPTFR